MRYFISLLFLSLLCVNYSLAGTNYVNIKLKPPVPSGGTTTEWSSVYQNVDGVPSDGSAVWNFYGTNQDRCYGHKEIKSGTGSITKINVRIHSNSVAPTSSWVCGYRSNGTLMGEAALPHVVDQWSGLITLTEASPGSLDYSDGEEIWYAGCYDTLGAGMRFSQDDNIANVNIEYAAVTVSGGCPASVTFSTSGSNSDMAIMAEFEAD